MRPDQNLPKTERGLTRAVEMNTQIAESYGKCDYSSPWAKHHMQRTNICRRVLDGMLISGSYS